MKAKSRRRAKKTQWREFALLIRETLPAFLAAVILVAGGICIYTGFEWSYLGVRQSVDAELRRDAYHDLDCLRLSAFSDAEIREVRETEGVSAAEGYNLAYGSFSADGTRQQAKILSLTENIDCLFALEGRLPQTTGETVINRHAAAQLGLRVGDTVRLDADARLFLTETDLTVVGLCESPAYLSDETATYGISYLTGTPLTCILYVRKDAFNPVLYSGSVGMLVRGEGLQENSVFSQEYQKNTDALREKLRAILGEDCDISTGAENPALTVADNAVIIFHQLKLTLGLMIVLISQLVCGITLVKLVNDRSVLIGMRKVLGFRTREIALPFAGYAALASFLGALLGLLLGGAVVSPAFASVAQESIFYENANPYLSVPTGTCIVLLCVTVSTLIAVLACRGVLRRPPLDLLNRTEEMHKGPRVRKGKHRLSLLTRTALSDLLGSRRRVLAGILSIAGCATLCISSVYVRQKVVGTVDYHYDNIQAYDTAVWFSGGDSTAAEIEKALQDCGFPYARVCSAIGQLETPDGMGLATYLLVPCDGGFDRLFCLKRPDGSVGSAADGVWINSAYAEYYGTRVGDTVKYSLPGKAPAELTVGGISEYYLQIPVAVMPAEAYERYFGEAPAANCVLAETGKTGARAASAQLGEIGGYLLSEDTYAKNGLYFAAMNRICSVFVIIFFVLSAVMAAFVILNLFLSLAERKKYELITLRINGYGTADARRYILTELLTLGAGGLLLGNVCGQLFGRLVVVCLSGNTDRYLSGFCLPACLWGTVSCAVMLAAVGFAALKKTGKFKLTEGNPLG